MTDTTLMTEEKMADDLEMMVMEQSGKQYAEGQSMWESCRQYLKGCADPQNARLYGTFQERAALNITQFPKIQGSLLIRMGLVYPIMSYLVEKMGLPKDAHSDLYGVVINYHTWIAGYLAYVAEIQLGMSKYPLEMVGRVMGYVKEKLK